MNAEKLWIAIGEADAIRLNGGRVYEFCRCQSPPWRRCATARR